MIQTSGSGLLRSPTACVHMCPEWHQDAACTCAVQHGLRAALVTNLCTASAWTSLHLAHKLARSRQLT